MVKSYRLQRRPRTSGHASSWAGLVMVAAVPATLVAVAVLPHHSPSSQARPAAAVVSHGSPGGRLEAVPHKAKSHTVLRSLVRFGMYRMVRHLLPHRLLWRLRPHPFYRLWRRSGR